MVEARQGQRQSRYEARLAAVQALYQMELSACDVVDVIEEFVTHRFGHEAAHYRNPDPEHFQNVLRGVVAHQGEIDKAVDRCLATGWTLGRLDSTLRALLRAGTYELFHRADIPARVIINEYVEVAHAFFDDAEPSLVNGVLDRLAHELRGQEFSADEKEGNDPA